MNIKIDGILFEVSAPILTHITILKAELKAAEDHAATMETCARDAEEKLKGSVPFEVFCDNAVGLSCHSIEGCGECEGEDKQTCPLILKEV